MYDVIFRNAKIIDGTSSPWFYGEVAVKDEKIKEVSYKITGKAKKIVDCNNMVLSPGFIDSHSHSDTCWFTDNRGESKIRQGVTTEVTGQCGVSPAPVTDKRKESVISITTDEGIEIEWATFGEYLSSLEKAGVGINIAPLVGHGALRSSAMGYENRSPKPEELAEMKDLLIEALESGAFGFSTGLIYPPGSFADTDELIQLAKTMSAYGGIYVTHIRNEGLGLLDAVEEALEIGRQGNVPVQLSHHKVSAVKGWGLVNKSLVMIEKAREQGLDVTCDQYPYIASSTGLTAIIPSWAHDGGPKALLARLEDPEISARLKEQVSERQDSSDGWQRILITSISTEKNKFAEGKRIPEIAKILNMTNVEAAFQLLIEEQLAVGYARFGMCEEDVRTVMAHPLVMFGSDSSSCAIDGPLSKGKPHPRTYGTFPRIIGKYVREEKVLTLENAVFKMTGMPATRLRLSDRGLIKPGMKADITVFDPDIIVDKATFQEPAQYPEGVDFVMVNGIPVFEDGEHTGNIAGKVLRRR